MKQKGGGGGGCRFKFAILRYFDREAATGTTGSKGELTERKFH